jgi:hypothetical protein
MDLPEVTIVDDSRAKLAVSTDEHPDSRVLLVDFETPEREVHMCEIGIASKNVEKLKKQATRKVVQYKSKDGALWITGDLQRWTLRIAVPKQPAIEIALDDDETAHLKRALFESIATGPLPDEGA